MLRYIMSVILVVAVAFGSSEFYVAKHSFAFYEAKKEQFFSTLEIRGISRIVTGRAKKEGDAYRGELKIDARQFESGSGMRDSHVREKYLHTGSYPYITYVFTLSDGVSSGDITVHGVTKKVTFPIDVSESNGSLIVTGTVRVKYEDFGIETPSNLILRAHDDLLIGATLFLEEE